MLSIKEYAKQNNITYEAVRQQIKRYREQLDDHIVQDGRTQYLDDIAVAFLDEKRQKNPVVVYQQGKDETIDELQKEVTRLLRRQEELRDQLDDLKEYKRLAEERQYALEDARMAQERRQQELLLREAAMDEEVRTAALEAAEDARAAAEAENAAEVARIQQEAEDRLAAAQEAHQQEMALEREKHIKTIAEMSEEMGGLLKEQMERDREMEEKDRRIQELESRTFGDYLKGLFRKKGKV